MNKKPESLAGVYGNLCVLYSNDFHPHRDLISLDIALPSPEVTGVALGGESRTSPASLHGQALS